MLRSSILLAMLCLGSCAGQAQEGLANAPSLNRAPSEDLGHDVIANGPEACSPGVGRPEAVKLPQCPESVSSATRSAPPTPASAPAKPAALAKPPARP